MFPSKFYFKWGTGMGEEGGGGGVLCLFNFVLWVEISTFFSDFTLMQGQFCIAKVCLEQSDIS
jgi:hypothetical protein